MLRSKRFLLALAVLAGTMISVAPALADSWSLAADFSSTTQGNHGWYYGMNQSGGASLSLSSPAVVWTGATWNLQCTPGVDMWGTFGDDGGGVFQTTATTTLLNYSGNTASGTMAAGKVGLFTGGNNFPVIARWTASTTGDYTFNVTFSQPVNATNGVYVNWVSPTANTRTVLVTEQYLDATHTSYFWSSSHHLAAGESLEFVVDATNASGANSYYSYISSGLKCVPVVQVDATITVGSAATSGTIAGVVKDTSGTALAGVAVQDTSSGGSTTTGTDGTYSLLAVPVGNRTIQARKAGYSTETTTVTVTPGGTANGDITTLAASFIGGAVTDSVNGSAPVIGATVSTSVGGYTATIGIDGTYSLQVSPGTYDLTAHRVNYTDARLTGIVVARAANVTGQNIPMTPVAGSVSGTVRDSTGTQLFGVTIQDLAIGGPSTTTAGDGSYLLNGVAPGSHTLQASKAGYSIAQLTSVSVSAGLPATGKDFTLAISPIVVRNVTSYGAVPNDDGDDLAAINNAIVASSPGDTVYFPSGTYRVSGIVIGKSGVRLEGATGSVLLYAGDSADCILGLYSVSNVTVTGLTLDGNNSANPHQGIWAFNSTEIILQNLTIRNLGNPGAHGIVCDPSVTDSTITNNTITNIATGDSWGAGIGVGHGSSRNWVQNNTIAHTGRGGILCSDDSTDLVIRNNTITGSGEAGGDTGLGIELGSGCHRALVEDNHIDHWISVGASAYCAVRRNTVSDKSGIYKFAGLEAGVQNSVLADNLVDGGAQIGISMSGWYPMQYVIWTRNTLKDCGTWGGQLQGDSGGIAYQYFYQNKFLNTNRDQPPAVYPNEGNGFRFNGNCHYVSLDGNEISNNEGYGIGPASSDLDHMSFTNNIIKNNGYDSVWDNFSSDLEWEGNTISGNRNNIQLASRGFSNSKPVAAFTCPTTVVPGQTVSFSNTSSDSDGSIGHVLWDFGDGLPSTDLSPTHTYTDLGSYIVTLVVWDNLGRGMVTTRNITVTNSLQVTPTDNLTANGFRGGPFGPASKSYTLTNVGDQSLNWTAAKSQPWFDLSSSSGVLAAGANTSVIVSFNAAANALTSSSSPYSDTVTFTNTTSGSGNTTRSVIVTVTTPVVGITNMAVLDPIMTTAVYNYDFVLWGMVSQRTASGFKIDDGSGVIISVDAPDNTVTNGNYVSVKGTLNLLTKTLTSREITVY